MLFSEYCGSHSHVVDSEIWILCQFVEMIGIVITMAMVHSFHVGRGGMAHTRDRGISQAIKEP